MRKFLNKGKTFVFFWALLAASGFAAAQTAPQNRTDPLILWWTDTSAPVWYEGKSLASTGSTVTVYAIPGTGYGASAANLTYTWNINAEPQPKISGIGKQIFTIAVSQAENVVHQIHVRVSNPEGTIKKESTLLLQTELPRLFVYSLLPTGGVASQNAIANFSGASGETYDFLAIPFFFRPEELNVLIFEWRLNGGATPNIGNTFTIQSAQEEISENAVTVAIRSIVKTVIPQKAQTSFNISIK